MPTSDHWYIAPKYEFDKTYERIADDRCVGLGAYLGEKLLRLTVFPIVARIQNPSISKQKSAVIMSILSWQLPKQKKRFDEALLLDSDGFLAEGPGEFIFLKKMENYSRRNWEISFQASPDLRFWN